MLSEHKNTNTKSIKKQKQRCANHTCNKRIKSMFDLECKCGAKFCCASHIVPYQDHDCDYDFASEEKQVLSNKLTTAYTFDNTKMTRI